MRKLLIILCVFGVIGFGCANTQISSREKQTPHFTYKTEYQERTSSSFCAILHITFNIIKPSSDEAEMILKKELESFIKDKPNNDIMAVAWFTPDGSEINEEMIPLLDGSKS